MPRGVRKRGRRPKFLGRILARIATPSSFFPIFSCRLLPRGSATYACVGLVEIRHVAFGRGRWRPKFLSRILSKIAIPISAYPIFSHRQLPRDSATYTCVGICRNMSCGALKGGRCPKFLRRILLKIAICSLRILFLASAGFRQHPPHIHVWPFVDIFQVACGRGPVSEVSESNLS